MCCTDDEGKEIDYDNTCIAAYDSIGNPNTKCQTDKCNDNNDKVCECAREYKPTCCDGITYSNECLADYDDQKIDDCTRGSCDENICTCSRELKPYCCTDHNRSEIDMMV